MNEKQFYELIESINSLGKIDWATIIISILGVLISGFIAFWIAKYQVDKSEEQFQKQIDENRHLEKEMYFRKTKIEDINKIMKQLEDIESFYNNQLGKLLAFNYSDINLDDLIKYHDYISAQYYNNLINFSNGIINTPFDKQEKDILDRLSLEKFNLNFYNDVIGTNAKLKTIYASWDLIPKYKSDNYNRIESARIAISKIIRTIFNVKILLNFLLEFNLNKMNNIKSKDTNINQMFFRLNKELKNYNFKEL